MLHLRPLVYTDPDLTGFQNKIVERRIVGNSNSTYTVAGMNKSDGLYRLLLRFGHRIYRSINGGNSWSEIQPDGDNTRRWFCSSISNDGSKMLASQYLIADGVSGKIFYSSDYGVNWTEVQPIDANLHDWYYCKISPDGSTLFACEYGSVSASVGGVYVSTNAGSSWTSISPVNDKRYATLGCSTTGQYVVTGVYGGRLYYSNNYGSSWSEIQPAGAVNRNWKTVEVSPDGTKILAGTFATTAGRMYLSINSGANWTELRPAGDVNFTWRMIDASDDFNKIMASGSYSNITYIFYSYDSGTNWIECVTGESATDLRTIRLTSDGTRAFITYYNGRLYNGY